MDFLRDELGDGEPKPVVEVKDRAEAENIAPDTLRRARQKLKVKAAPSSMAGKWEYRWTGGRQVDLEDVVEDQET